METYRNIWNNLFNYLKEHWKIKDCEQITHEHIMAYIDYKIEYYPSKQYLQKIISSIKKLEIALNLYSKDISKKNIIYNFDGRLFLLQEAKDLKLVVSNYHYRAYGNPMNLVNNLSNSQHKLAALIEYEGGARIEACSLIKIEQLKGIKFDPISSNEKGIIFTKEKGGKEGDVLISPKTYYQLEKYFYQNNNKSFKINRQKYMKDIRDTCKRLKINPEGSHGLRWNFAKNRMLEYAKYGYTYEQSLQAVSWEMKHNRASITEHYIG